MKTRKVIFGLLLCGGTILGMNSLQKHTEANIGWAVAECFDASNDGKVGAIMAGGCGGGAAVASVISGAEIGAKIGVWGGLAGIAAGAIVGGF